MDRYNPNGKCIKCGSGEIENEHREAYVPTEHVKAFAVALGNKIDSKPERIVRLCKNCGFPWLEAPLNPTSFKASDIGQPEIEVCEGDWVKREGVYCEPSTRGCKVVGVTDARIALATNRLLCTCHFPKWYEHTIIHKGPSKPNEICMGQAEVSVNGRYWQGPLPPKGTPDGRYNVYLRPVENSQ